MITSTAWYNPNEIKLYFDTKFSSIYITKVEKRLVFRLSFVNLQRLVFRLSFVNLQRAKGGIHMFDVKYKYVFVV